MFFGRTAEKGLGVPGGSCERSSVKHRVVWLLGTSCCLMVLQEAGLAVSELLRTALNSWQEPDAAGLPRRPRRWDEALPPCSPWTDASAGPLPRRLCSFLFGEAQADVVNLNCFLIRLSPLPGWVSSARNLDCITTTPPGTWPRTGRSWSGCGWMLGQPPRSCQLGDGTHVMDGALLWLLFIIEAKWEESGTSPLRNPGAQLGLRGPWGPIQLLWICPLLVRCLAPASESSGSLFKKPSPRPAAVVLNWG